MNLRSRLEERLDRVLAFRPSPPAPALPPTPRIDLVYPSGEEHERLQSLLR